MADDSKVGLAVVLGDTEGDTDSATASVGKELDVGTYDGSVDAAPVGEALRVGPFVGLADKLG